MDRSQNPPPDKQEADADDRSQLIFCGMCGALNPSASFYCAACGTTLVDAFHATEGLRVHERPDSASRLIEIVASGSELEIAEDPNAPQDFVRVRLASGKLGYIRLLDVNASSAQRTVATSRYDEAADINSHAKGCVSTTGALGAVALAVVLGALVLVIMLRSNTYDQGTFAIVFCFGVGPFFILTVALYLYSRSREDRLAAESEDAELERAAQSGDS
ncbi:MAG: hypothetical protein WKF81_07500 [Thermomicrobiales bacterium]